MNSNPKQLIWFTQLTNVEKPNIIIIGQNLIEFTNEGANFLFICMYVSDFIISYNTVHSAHAAAGLTRAFSKEMHILPIMIFFLRQNWA